MGKFIDLTGMKFGRLTVIERAGSKNGCAAWKCRCECGKKHGMINTPIYRVWDSIKARCFNPNNKSYCNYGGRGISMYPGRIEDFKAFYDYVSTLEHFNAEGYSLDRIDNNSNYEPGNLRRADRKTQNNNQRKTIFVEYSCLSCRYHRGDRGERLFRPVKTK